MKKSRNFQITINNPHEHDITQEKIIELLNNENVKYACGKEEIGDETHTNHLHVFVIFKSPRYPNAVIDLFKSFNGAHVEVCRGSIQENIDYIKKEETTVDGTFFEIGDIPKGQGNRSDIVLIKDLIEEGYSADDIVDLYTHFLFQLDKIEILVRHYRMKKYSKIKRDIKVTYIYGQSGVGKTRYVVDKIGLQNMYRVTQYKHPFDSYKGQKVLVLDEFRFQIGFSEMLNLLDIYPVELDCRYNNNIACYTRVYVISNIPIEQQYPDIDKSSENWKAFLRRIDDFIVMDSISKTYYPNYEMYNKGLGISLEEHEREVDNDE